MAVQAQRLALIFLILHWHLACNIILDMNMKSIVVPFTFVWVAGLAGAQTPVFNFQKIDVGPNFSASSISNSGTIAGSYDSPAGGSFGLWSQQYGLTEVEFQQGDDYLSDVQESGKLYGTSAGKVFSIDQASGRKDLSLDANFQYNIVNANGRDGLLLKGTNGSQTKYFKYTEQGVTQLPNLPATEFIPRSITPMALFLVGSQSQVQNLGSIVFH